MNEHERISKFLPLMKNLYETAKESLGFQPDVKIVILKDDENMKNPLGKTAHYSPSEQKICLYTQGRHIKDILRSLSHELVHHNQNCRGDFEENGETFQGYAQEDGPLREMEREAYERGNMIFRDWEDNLKNKGGKPLFTSTKQYVRPMTTDVVGGRLLEGNKMKKKINESNLRDIIRGVIQEMFNDDLNEISSAGVASLEAARGEEEGAEAKAAAALAPSPGEPKGPFELEENMETIKMKKKKLKEAIDTSRMGTVKGTPKSSLRSVAQAEEPERYERGEKIGGPKMFEVSGDEEKEHYEEDDGADVDHIHAIRRHLDALEKDKDYDEGHEALQEISGEEEKEHYEEDDWADVDHIEAIRRHLDALEKDKDYDEGHEELEETFFPKNRSLREKARMELNETLVRRWTKMIK